MKTFYLSLAALLLTILSANATDIGYTTGYFDKNKNFSTESNVVQGQAIRLDSEKLKMLQGKTITAIQAVFGSKNTIDKAVTLFITKELGGTPLVEQTGTISSAAAWLTYTLDNPYTITGDEGELYIGYRGTLIVSSYKMLSTDMTTDMKACSYGMAGDKWVDLNGYGKGCANIRITVEGLDGFTDLCMKNTKYDAYFKSGETYKFSNQLFNFGSQTVNSFDVVLKLGNEVQTFPYTGLELAPAGTYDFELPEFEAKEDGDLEMEITVCNINGSDDADMSDNTQAEQLYFYPANMERALLVEEFTGQDCSNCPSGHATLVNVLNGLTEPYVEIDHHAGYYPDMFSMTDDWEYTFLYGSTSTYAPAAMVNRTVVPELGAHPVTGVTNSILTTALNYAANEKPYVSLKLETAYDASTREMTINFHAIPHTELPAGQNLINVVLVQDNIKAYQSNGGASYNHRYVFRGTLTNNTWGLIADFEPGKPVSWSTKVELPEAIRSSYYTSDDLLNSKGYTEDMINWPTDPENTYIVAYVSGYSPVSTALNKVYNCVQAKLGESYTQAAFDDTKLGVEDIQAAQKQAYTTVKDGRIVCEGADRVEVYSVGGHRMNANASLPHGLYIVRMTAGGKQLSEKVIVK